MNLSPAVLRVIKSQWRVARDEDIKTTITNLKDKDTQLFAELQGVARLIWNLRDKEVRLLTQLQRTKQTIWDVRTKEAQLFTKAREISMEIKAYQDVCKHQSVRHGVCETCGRLV